MDALKEIAGLANHLRHGNVTLWAIADDEYCAEMGLTVEEQGETLSEFLHGVAERIDSEVRFTEGTSGKAIERADRYAEWLNDIEAELFGERIETFTHGDHERQSERINDILVAAKDKASQMPKGVDWPRFEDGEPVRFLDDFERYGYENDVSVVTMYTDGSFAINFRAYSKGERVKRPAPKVLDADGVEIEAGDDLYSVEGILKFHVSAIDKKSGRIATEAMFALDKWADPKMYTHRAPVLAADGRPLREGDKPYRVDNGKQVEVRRVDPDYGEECVFVGIDGTALGYWLRPGQLTHESPVLDADLTMRNGNGGTMSIYDIEQRPFPPIIQVIRDRDGSHGVEMRRYFPERTCRADLTESNEPANINTWECSLCGKSYEEAYGSYEYCPHCGARIVEERR